MTAAECVLKPHNRQPTPHRHGRAMGCLVIRILEKHDDVIKWKHFPRYWPFDGEFTGDPHKGQWRGALMCSLICAWINAWVNNDETGDLRCHCAHYDITVMNWPHYYSTAVKGMKTIWQILDNTLTNCGLVIHGIEDLGHHWFRSY